MSGEVTDEQLAEAMVMTWLGSRLNGESEDQAKQKVGAIYEILTGKEPPTPGDQP